MKNESEYPSFSTTNNTGIPLFLLEEDDDVPRPTENGGYTHTSQSKAKISAANKGKTPWNKGVNRSEDVKARIAAGVRARNRERFLQKLRDMGLTEEEYEEQKKQERKKRDAERRARRTENGGYRPTNETRQKISQILREKYAAGEIKPRTVDASKIRRGFTHSPETKAKISESLKKRWATDPEYRANMKEKTLVANTDESIRKKIAETLRLKWQDPDFRAQMMSKFTNRKRSPGIVNEDHRQKISAAMKAKWQDEEYRQKTLQSIAKRQESMRSTQAEKPKTVQQKTSVAKAKLPKKQQERPAWPTSTTSPANTDDVFNNEIVIINDDDDSNEDAHMGAESHSKPRPVQPLTQPKAKRKRTAATTSSASTAATALTEPRKTAVVTGVVKVTPPPSSTSRLLQRQPTAMPERAATLSSARVAQPKRKKQSVNDNQSPSSQQRNAVKYDSSEAKQADTKSLTDWRLVDRDDAIVSDKDFYDLVGTDDDGDNDPLAAKAKRKKQQPPQQQQAGDGNVELLRAERRDLYDLLYGDGDDDDHTDPLASSSSSLFALGDENLDEFDPYGLEDF